MDVATNSTEINVPNKKIVFECLNYIDTSFAELPTASEGEIARCKEQFMREYSLKWKELLDAEKLREIDIRDGKLDKLEDAKIQTVSMRKNKPQEISKDFAEKFDLDKQILFLRNVGFDETPIKGNNLASKSERDELAKRCQGVLKEIDDLKATAKNFDAAICKLQNDNQKIYQDYYYPS